MIMELNHSKKNYYQIQLSFYIFFYHDFNHYLKNYHKLIFF